MFSPAALLPLVARVCRSHHWTRADREHPPQHRWRPLTDRTLAHHVNGGPACGACPITPGQDTTRTALLDLDAHGEHPLPWSAMLEAATVIIRVARLCGLEPIPFRSTGGSGIHLYFLWDQPQSAYSVRFYLADVLRAAGFTPGTGGVAKGTVEIFPKQDKVARSGAGSMFILPGSGRSAALSPIDLADLPPAWLGMEDAWPSSMPVPAVAPPARPQKSLVAGRSGPTLKLIVEALNAIPNCEPDELGYDDWFRVLAALHNVTQGGDEGLVLAHDFSARSSKYSADDLDRRWNSLQFDREGAPSAGEHTIFYLASQHGWMEDVRDSFPVVEGEDSMESPLPAFARDKQGRILPTINNVVMALTRGDWTRLDLAYDKFRDTPMLARHGTEGWRNVEDTDLTRLRQILEMRRFLTVPKEMLRDCLRAVALLHAFDSAQLWLNELEWDGIPRIDTFFARYMATPLSPYNTAVARYMWSALAGRIMDPGCQADMMPVFAGLGGARKTSLVMSLVPSPEFFGKVSLTMDDTDFARRIRGKLVCEVEELRGLGSRDSESIKALLTRRREEWTPKYLEYNTVFARRCVLIGTTDRDAFLEDSSRNFRRFLPVWVTRAAPELVAQDRLQLWAEARLLWEQQGVCYRDAEVLAIDEYEVYSTEDILLPKVCAWLADCQEPGGLTYGERPFHLAELAQGLGYDVKHMEKRHEMKLGNILRSLGYNNARRRDDKAMARRMWVKKTPAD